MALINMYKGVANSPETKLASAINSTVTSITVLDGSILPVAPNLLVIGGDTDNPETVRMTAKSGNTLTVERAFQGTAQNWVKDSIIGRNFTAYDYDTLVDNINYVDSRVKTDVPINANFTQTTINGKTGVITKDDIVALGIPSQDTVVDISGKQDKLIAGTNISIIDDVINSSGSGASYTAGKNIEILDGEISTTALNDDEVSYKLGEKYRWEVRERAIIELVNLEVTPEFNNNFGGYMYIEDYLGGPLLEGSSFFLEAYFENVKIINEEFTVDDGIIDAGFESGIFAIDYMDEVLVLICLEQFDKIVVNGEGFSDIKYYVYSENENEYPDGELLGDLHYKKSPKIIDKVDDGKHIQSLQQKKSESSLYKITKQETLIETNLEFSTAPLIDGLYTITIDLLDGVRHKISTAEFLNAKFQSYLEGTVVEPKGKTNLFIGNSITMLVGEYPQMSEIIFKSHSQIDYPDFKINLLEAEFMGTEYETYNEYVILAVYIQNNQFKIRNDYGYIKKANPVLVAPAYSYDIGSQNLNLNTSTTFKIGQVRNQIRFILNENITDDDITPITPITIIFEDWDQSDTSFIDEIEWIDGTVESELGENKVSIVKILHYKQFNEIKFIGWQVGKQNNLTAGNNILENYREKLVTLSGTSTAIDLSLANVFTHSLTGNTTYSITNAVSGEAHSFTLIINQTVTVRTLTFPASVKWQGGEIPDLSGASKTYVLTFMTIDGGTTWLGMFGGEF